MAIMADQWYYATDEQQSGPIGLTELQQLAASGKLRPTDLVWRDGMHQWAPAEVTRGLFTEQHLPPPPAPPLSPQPEPAAPAHAPAEGPGSRPIDRRPRPGKRAPAGMSTGAKVALIGGIAGAVLLVIVVIFVVALSNRSNPAARTYTVNLNQNATDNRKFQFTAGSRITISVRSDFETDVDLYVYDSRGALIAVDNGPQKDCFVNFRAPRTEWYRIELRNLGPGPNRSVVTYN